MLAQIITTTIDREQMLALLTELIPSLRTAWGPQIVGTHGGVTQVPIEQQWLLQVFPVEMLIQHLVAEESRVRFRVSQWDYWLHDPREVETIHLCHESDLHFDLAEGTLRTRVLHIFMEKGIAHFEGR
jgi:hypothetical protein